MKNFLDIISEEEKKAKRAVLAFGRMNPPTSGHLKLIDKVRHTAEKQGASHHVVVSHSQDSKKNPLSPEQKVKHLRRYSPGTHFTAASSDHPTILHHLAKLHASGHTHVTVVAGSDRVKEMHHLLHKYNGVKGKHGHYHFKKIEVHSAGHRDPDAEGTEGMSGTKMREHAKNKDFSSFRQGVPHHVSDEHAKELMHDVRHGMGLHEDYNRGLCKAIFVTGGPGSGKDIVIRESIAESKCREFNYVQIKRIYESDFIKNHLPVIINGPAEDIESIITIKQMLESFGYETMMVFVDTTNHASQQRNQKLSRMMVESVRADKWEIAQKNKNIFNEIFDKFIYFDNSGDIDSIEEDITRTYLQINNFLDEQSTEYLSYEWFKKHRKVNVDSMFKVNENVKKDSKQIQKSTVVKYNPEYRAATPSEITPDNRAGESRWGDDIKGDTPARKNPGKTYTFRTYSEENGPKIKYAPLPKESNFSKDKEKTKIQKRGDKSLSSGKIGNPPGIGQEYDTRAGGQGAAAGAGLGNQTYSEDTEYSNAQPCSAAMPGSSALQPNPLSNDYDNKKTFKKIKKIMKEFNGFQNDVDSGVGGVLGGSSNKEPMQSYKDQENNIGIKITKKKGKKNVS